MIVAPGPILVGSSDHAGTLRLMLRHRRLLTVVALSAALLASLIALVLPPTYTATARLLPPQQSQSLATLFMGQAAASPLASMAQKEFGLKNPADIYIGLLNSRSIQDGLIHDFDLARVYRLRRPSEVRNELATRTRIQLTKEGLIAVSVDDQDAIRSAALANGYAEELRRTTKRLAMSEAGQRRQFFEDQARQVREDLVRAESAFSSVQQQTGILQVDAQAKALIETAASLRGQIAAGEVQLQVLRNFGTEQNPDVRRQESQVSGWRAELIRLESQQSSDPVFSKGRAPAQAQQYVRTMREVRYGEALLEMLLRQSEAAKLDEARETTIIQVVDVAVPPDVRTSPKRTAIVLLTTLASVMGTICFLRLRQRFHAEPEWQLRCAQLRAEWHS